MSYSVQSLIKQITCIRLHLICSLLLFRWEIVKEKISVMCILNTPCISQTSKISSSLRWLLNSKLTPKHSAWQTGYGMPESCFMGFEILITLVNGVSDCGVLVNMAVHVEQRVLNVWIFGTVLVPGRAEDSISKDAKPEKRKVFENMST